MLEDILQKHKDLFEAGMTSVLRGQENRRRIIVLQNGNLVQNERSSERGICARVSLNGSYGFASNAEYSDDAAIKTIKAATENAKYLARYNNENKVFSKVQAGNYIRSKRMIIDFEQKRLIDLCKEIDAYIEKTYTDLVSRTVVYREDTMEKNSYK